MDIILGIDVGGSTTKVVGLDVHGNPLSMLRVRAEDQVTSLFGALGNYLSSNHLTLEDVRRVVLTGVGASYVDGNIYGLPTYRVDEFSASGAGALALSICLLKRRGYKAFPLRKVNIAKANGKTRSLGIPTMKDRAAKSRRAAVSPRRAAMRFPSTIISVASLYLSLS